MDKRTPYETDLNYSQWQPLQPLLPLPAAEGRPINREIVNALLYTLKSGCDWRLLSRDLPKWQSVYYYFHFYYRKGTCNV